ncbi:MAG TPA: hypothetical protein PK677_14335 [Acidiphilium sp.]|nr:hypothetical protein [Acidiphilium sp.]
MKTKTVAFGGRSFTLRKVTLGDQMQLMEMGVDPKNEAYFSVCLLCFSVDEIDGVPPPPVKDRAGLIRLGHQISDATEALLEAFKELNGDAAAVAEVEVAKN